MPSISARWLFDGKGCLYEHALLAWEGERIIAVEPGRASYAEQRFGQALIMPGLVNAHTHLDLSDLSMQESPRDPCSWLGRVVAYRRTATAASICEAVRRGIVESVQHGVTLVGDIAATRHTLEVLRNSPLRATVFLEILGLSKSRARAAWQAARALLRSETPAGHYCLGLSPHSPYSTRRGLFCLAAQTRLPLAIHFAEFAEELALLTSHTGPFRAWLESLSAWDETALFPSYESLLRWLRSATRLLLVHVNYPTEPLVTTLVHWAGNDRVGVVYCPRTHAYFGHPPHPWLQLLQRGVPIVFGTDSRASNPDLDLLAELRYVWQRGCPLTPAELFQMATHTAAKLLNWTEAGFLAPGRLADFLVIPLEAANIHDPLRTLLETDSTPQHVYVGGQLVYAAGSEARGCGGTCSTGTAANNSPNFSRKPGNTSPPSSSADSPTTRTWSGLE
ncbi:Aminodeoxyfutalosine deaminase [bacterium HR36]|nr:Aminodeoxyfutalosine deaminase [bacterium HR36]